MSNKSITLADYFEDWVDTYKKGAVRQVTLSKYHVTLRRIKEIAPELRVENIDKRTYQWIINKYAEDHEKQTTMDFHHHLKSVILDAIDEGLLKLDPTRRAIIKGKTPNKKKPKFLSQHELQLLLKALILKDEPDWDWFILLLAKTGLRFSEALSLTPGDFDFNQHKIKVTRTWNYKDVEGGFGETKNFSSKRTVQIDHRLSQQFFELTKQLSEDNLIFVSDRVFNSTVNNRLKTLCEKANVPVISLHSLRHTHASHLLNAKVSIASIAKRLGHANVSTTQDTYIHIIKELEEKDNDKVMDMLALLA
jgi:integrase